MTIPRLFHSSRLQCRWACAGVLCWIAFAVVAVAVRGPRWEESYEFGQVLLGLIPYPEGHPIRQHVGNMFCLQNYVTAALMHLSPEPWLVCGFRNALYLVARSVPFFLFGLLLTRRVAWAHAIAAVAFLGSHGMHNAYPAMVWPTMATNGAIGAGASLLALYFFAAGRTRAAYFMAAVMPAIHIGQCPPILAVAALHALINFRSGTETFRRDAIAGLAGGLVVTGISLAFFMVWRVPPPASGPYHGEVPWKAVWQGYMHAYNDHRVLQFGRDQIVLVWMAVLGSVLALTEFKEGRRGPWFWMGAYGWFICLIVWSIMALHYMLGDNVPPVLLNWMPYRLPNHLVPLLVVMMLAVTEDALPVRAGAFLIMIALAAVAGGIHEDHLFLALSGVATHAVYFRLKADRRLALFWLLGVAAGCLVLSFTFSGFEYWWLGGWALAAFLEWLNRGCLSARRTVRFTPAALAGCIVAAVAATLGACLHEQWQNRNTPVIESLHRTPFEEDVRRYLAQRGDDTAMLLVPMQLWSLQERLNHPVMTEGATLSWIPYRKSLGPILHKMFKEIYGVDLASPKKPKKGQWLYGSRELWMQRSVQDWQRLGAEYDFSYVLALKEFPLKLPVAVDGAPFQLYAIPAPRRDP